MATSPDGLFEMNDTHIEQFYRDGYFVAPRLIDRETVENVIDDFAVSYTHLTLPTKRIV